MSPRSAKIRFQEDSARAQAWRDFTASNAFQAALDAALLQFVDQCGFGANPFDAQVVAHRIDGAKKFAEVLMRLGDQVLPAKPSPDAFLDYQPSEVPQGLRPQTKPPQ